MVCCLLSSDINAHPKQQEERSETEENSRDEGDRQLLEQAASLLAFRNLNRVIHGRSGKKVSANLVDEEIGHEEQAQTAQTHCEVREVGLVNLQDYISLEILITQKKRSSGVLEYAEKSP